jgi:hypothetical protein
MILQSRCLFSVTESRKPIINTLRRRINREDQGCRAPSTAMCLGNDKTSASLCDPSTINLEDYDQWVDETGYWIGEYTFLKEDGKPYSSSSWPYRYDSYIGFITGSVKGWGTFHCSQLTAESRLWFYYILKKFLTGISYVHFCLLLGTHTVNEMFSYILHNCNQCVTHILQK